MLKKVSSDHLRYPYTSIIIFLCIQNNEQFFYLNYINGYVFVLFIIELATVLSILLSLW